MSSKVIFATYIASVSFFVQTMEIEQKNLFIPEKLGEIKVIYKEKEFFVNNYLVPRHALSKELRGIDQAVLSKFLTTGFYLSINNFGNNEFNVQLKGRLNGGGIFGTYLGACLGKAAVSVAGHGTIYLIGALTGPAAPMTIIALESIFAPAIESASLAGAVAGGIALGAATGPV